VSAENSLQNLNKTGNNITKLKFKEKTQKKAKPGNIPALGQSSIRNPSTS
jgi:hypothetical protein